MEPTRSPLLSHSSLNDAYFPHRTPTTSTCSNCVALSVKNQKLEADNERLLKQLSATQAELRCLREKQSVENGRADQELGMAVPEIVIKMEPMPEIDEELRFQDDLLDIKPDPLEAELQMEVAYISSVASAAKSIDGDISERELFYELVDMNFWARMS